MSSFANPLNIIFISKHFFKKFSIRHIGGGLKSYSKSINANVCDYPLCPKSVSMLMFSWIRLRVYVYESNLWLNRTGRNQNNPQSYNHTERNPVIHDALAPSLGGTGGFRWLFQMPTSPRIPKQPVNDLQRERETNLKCKMNKTENHKPVVNQSIHINVWDVWFISRGRKRTGRITKFSKQ